MSLDGFLSGIIEAGKAAKWYWKSAKKLIGQYSKEQIKDLLNGVADTAIQAGCHRLIRKG